MTTSRLIQNVAAALREEGIDMEDKLQVLSRSRDVTDPFKHLDSISKDNTSSNTSS